MAALRWVAEGIAVAEAAGGLTLERYRRPGFAGGQGVRARGPADVEAGWALEVDPDPPDDLRAPTRQRGQRRPPGHVRHAAASQRPENAGK